MNLSCPLPKLDFDTINLGHGSGGTLTAQLLETDVVERGKGDKIFSNTTGSWEVQAEANIDAANIKTGERIILSGPLARHGITIMSHRQGLQFETTIRSETRPLNKIIPQLLDE